MLGSKANRISPASTIFPAFIVAAYSSSSVVIEEPPAGAGGSGFERTGFVGSTG